jgi:hypothetical protein
MMYFLSCVVMTYFDTSSPSPLLPSGFMMNDDDDDDDDDGRVRIFEMDLSLRPWPTLPFGIQSHCPQ